MPASSASASARAIVKAVADQNVEPLSRALGRHRGPVPAQATVNAGRRTDLLKAIDAAGARLSPRAIFRSAGIQIDQ